MISKFEFLTDEQLDKIYGVTPLKEAYKALRDHHMAETEELYFRLSKMREKLYGQVPVK